MTSSIGKALPVEYEAGRFFVCPVTSDGQRMRFFTDTGGASFLTQAAIARLNLYVEKMTIGSEVVVVSDFPEFAESSFIPNIRADVDPRYAPLRGRLFVRDVDTRRLRADGMLGQEWFGGRIWTFDYPAKKLLLHDVATSVSGNVRIGFPVDATGRRLSHFPSIEAAIDGETNAFLFDTGATVRLSASARAALGTDAEDQGTSFIVGSIFDRWRALHPDWPFLPDADQNVGLAPMIEVPAVTIAGHEVGPVWFTRREDRNFHDFMSSMMDHRIDGALGASVLSYFRITVDYPNAVASFAI